MLKFRQVKSLQKFVSVHASVNNHFNAERHLIAVRLTNSAAPPSWPSGKS